MQISRYEEHGSLDQMTAAENALDDEGDVEVLIQFHGGEVWAAVNIAAREHMLEPAVALAACVAYGLWVMGYDVPTPTLVRAEWAA